jgi:hypothetical protein
LQAGLPQECGSPLRSDHQATSMHIPNTRPKGNALQLPGGPARWRWTAMEVSLNLRRSSAERNPPSVQSSSEIKKGGQGQDGAAERRECGCLWPCGAGGGSGRGKDAGQGVSGQEFGCQKEQCWGRLRPLHEVAGSIEASTASSQRSLTTGSTICAWASGISLFRPNRFGRKTPCQPTPPVVGPEVGSRLAWRGAWPSIRAPHSVGCTPRSHCSETWLTLRWLLTSRALDSQLLVPCNDAADSCEPCDMEDDRHLGSTRRRRPGIMSWETTSKAYHRGGLADGARMAARQLVGASAQQKTATDSTIPKVPHTLTLWYSNALCSRSHDEMNALSRSTRHHFWFCDAIPVESDDRMN